MKKILSLLLLGFAIFVNGQEYGTPPVIAPYPKNLDRAATNEWWLTAKKAREGKENTERHPANSITVTGKHFLDLEVDRDKVVCFALYTVHNKILKMSAQLFPLYPKESREVTLEIEKNGSWQKIATAKVNDLGWSALFRVENWDDSQNYRYRVRHGEKAEFSGTIRKNPIDKKEIVVASFSCNSSRDRMDRDTYIKNLLVIDPDLLFFAGDQHYDHTEHTAGWIMFGVQFRELFRDRPVVTIPDDHDVGQANLWGENGKVADSGAGDSGGYFYHPEYVKQVERCQTAHLPDPVDPKPIGQGIGVYFTNLNLGGVDFAIIEDRKFKSGPKGKIPRQGPRPDHIRNADYKPESIDLEGLELLGERQLKFLESWGVNWQGVEMKAVLSQTPFAGAAHLHGGPDPVKNRLHADLDSNGWPQKGRNNALKTIRKCFAIHLAGDQHLSTLLKHGIDEWNEGPWSVVSPAIVNTIYGRYWLPEDGKAGKNPVSDLLPYTGEYLDGFHNKITMHAYVNPTDKDVTNSNGAGFVICRFNKETRNIQAESWPRYADLSKSDAKMFTGWPKIIPQLDNYNPPSWGKSAELSFNIENPIVQLIDKDNGEILYTIRIKGKIFTPHLPNGKKFIIKAGKDSPSKIVAEEVTSQNSEKLNIILE